MATETRTEPTMMDRADPAAGGRMASSPGTPGSHSPPAAASTSSTAATETRGPATLAGPASGLRGGKRMQWTRDSIIDELARWMVTGTAIEASFLKRNGPPGLVPAAIRIFGRFDAALNVAGLHVAKLYPPDSQAPDGLDARRPRRPTGRR